MDNLPVGQAGQDKTIAILVHIGGFLFSGLVPLIVYLLKKDESDQFTTDNAREALNFQITVLLAYCACFILSFILIGLFMFWMVGLANLVLSVVASVKASNGITYRYPLTIRLIK